MTIFDENTVNKDFFSSLFFFEKRTKVVSFLASAVRRVGKGAKLGLTTEL